MCCCFGFLVTQNAMLPILSVLFKPVCSSPLKGGTNDVSWGPPTLRAQLSEGAYLKLDTAKSVSNSRAVCGGQREAQISH